MAIDKAALRPLGQRADAPKTEPAPPAAVLLDPRMQAETAAYIFNMTAELTHMARTAKLDLLAYFLDMARIEAGSLREID